VLSQLLRSKEPSVRWKARLGILDEDPESRSMRALREQIRHSRRAKALLRDRMRPGRSAPPGVYHKWLGIHWALAHLADLGYPPGDRVLEAGAGRALDLWMRPSYLGEFRAETREEASTRYDGVPVLRGRYRRCASQQGNALYYCTTLGVADEGCDRLAQLLRRWQWPDGGWNCDRDPGADTSSFAETLTPTRGLAVYGQVRGRPSALEAAARASEVFLRRRLFRRLSDGRVMRGEFLRVHYPLYWHYDILGALRVLATLERLHDPRCQEALDLLESKELPRGGWAAERRYYDLPGERPRRGQERVRWGPVGAGRNDWVTVDALAVLRAAGRYSPTG